MPARGLMARLSALQFLEYFVWGAWVVPISGYMNGALGFNGAQIGWVCAAWALAAIVSPLFVGYVADRFFASERVLAALHAAGAVCLLAAGMQTSFPALLTAVLLHALCFMPALPLADNLAFRSLADASRFSRIAIGGSVGWIVAGLAVGLVIGESTGAFFLLAAAVEGALALYCLTLPHTPPGRTAPASGDVLGLGAFRLLAQPAFLVFVAVIPLIAISKTFYTTWTNAFLNELELPRPTALMTLAQASDIVVKGTLPWFIARIGLRNVLVAGMAAWMVRYLAFASLETPAIVAGLLLHGLSYGFVVTGASIYAARVSPPGMSARAQSFVTVLVFGIGTFVGAQAAGLAGHHYRGRPFPEWRTVAARAGAAAGRRSGVGPPAWQASPALSSGCAGANRPPPDPQQFMDNDTRVSRSVYDRRLAALRQVKIAQTAEKQAVRGAMDFDDHGIVLPPAPLREVVRRVSGSGVNFQDVILNTFRPASNHPGGGFFGPRACGENFRALLDRHPVYVDPMSSLAGAYMVNFMSYRAAAWNPDFDREDLLAQHARYGIVPGIGAVQHMCQDLAIGLELGWDGLLEKVRRHRAANPAGEAFYEGLEQVILGLQDWIRRHAAAARAMTAEDPELARNLVEVAAINERLATHPPRTFREACQWILWYLLAARMYNGSASLGRLDVLLLPYYEADRQAGRLDDEEAVFHLACMLLRDTAYLQLGGPDAAGCDVTNPVSFLALEAAHRLRIPVNVGVCVGSAVDPRLLERGVAMLLEDRCGVPKFLGVDNTVAGFTRNGFPLELARERAYAGCHWSSIPGREYGIQDIIKINLAKVFDVALREMLTGGGGAPSTEALWETFAAHLRHAIGITAAGIDFHYEHMHEVFPELVLDLLCHGPIERGLDASHGGVDFYTFGVDAAGLATTADSFAAIEARIERQQRLSWDNLLACLDAGWQGEEGERLRRTMRNTPRYGAGGTRADAWAARIARTFAETLREKPTPAGQMMIPGLFSWSIANLMGAGLGATPNGRRAGEPISHGANPDPGFRKDGAPTAIAAAVAAVQPGFGNTAPLQLDLDPTFTNTPDLAALVAGLIRGHFDAGGTQINANILDREQLLEAHRDPSRFPDLVVRVTGFSAYFASLSPELRQSVVERVIREAGA